jgi:hypothetical protein
VAAGHPQQAGPQGRDQQRDRVVGRRPRAGAAHADVEVLAVERHVLAPQQGRQDLHVLLGVPARMGVREPVGALDHRLVRGADAEREAGPAERGGDGPGPGRHRRRMGGVGLQHGRTELDPLGRPAGQGEGDRRVAGDGAGVPDGGEPVGLGPLGLVDDPVDGCTAAAESDPHGRQGTPTCRETDP